MMKNFDLVSTGRALLMIASMSCAACTSPNPHHSMDEAQTHRSSDETRSLASASVIPERGTLLIAKTAPVGNPILRNIQFGVGKMTDGDINCGTLQNGSIQDEFTHAAYPEAGSVIVMKNSAAEPLLIYAFVNEADETGGNDHFTGPTVDPGIARPRPADLQQFSEPQDVIQLNPGDSVAMVLAPAVPRSSGLSTDLQFSCKTLSSFAARPKFSYGTQFEMNSDF